MIDFDHDMVLAIGFFLFAIGLGVLAAWLMNRVRR